MDLKEITGLIASFSYIGVWGGVIDQIIKIKKSRKSRNISLFLYIILLITSLSWFSHGLTENDIYLMISYGVNFILVVIILIFIIKFRKEEKEEKK